MQTKEIPKDQWPSFMDSFSRRHEMWRISVDVLAPDLGAQTEMEEIPLMGISADEKDGENSIAIMAGEGPKTQVTHFVQQPSRVWLEQSEEGADQALEIESANGIKTIVRFRAAVLPEEVDGADI